VDSGLVCRLLGIKTAEELFVHPNRGNIFESFVVSEILKNHYNRGLDADIFFRRDSTGNEIDIVFQEEQRLKALEIIKSGKTSSLELALCTRGLDTIFRLSARGLQFDLCRRSELSVERASHNPLDKN